MVDKLKIFRLELDLSPAEICTAQQKGARVVHGRVMFYTKDKVAKSNNKIYSAIVKEIKNSNIPLTTKLSTKNLLHKVLENGIAKERPVAVIISYLFPFPKSATQKRIAKGAEYMVQRPDLDNLTKSILDELTALGFWVDDSQVVDCHTRKFRSVQCGIIIEIHELKDLF